MIEKCTDRQLIQLNGCFLVLAMTIDTLGFVKQTGLCVQAEGRFITEVGILPQQVPATFESLARMTM